MSPTLTTFAAIALLLAGRGIVRGQHWLRHTTLLPAARWALAATLLWSLSLLLGVFNRVSPAMQDALWYATALVAVCPAVSVLGARRPGARVWTLFVVLPLLAELGWPLMTIWSGGGEIRTLRLETPQLIGFVLVLLMGSGNYLGTRYSLPAAIFIVALCLVVGSVSAVAPTAVQGSWLARQLATIALGLSVLLAERISLAIPTTARSSGDDTDETSQLATFDRLWHDYRETFGIVWAKRFQERMNGIAAQQQWPARLGDAGLEWQDSPNTDQDLVQERIDQTFRWLLRRFVDPPWIDERVATDRQE